MLLCDYYEQWIDLYKKDVVRKVTLNKYFSTLKSLRMICPDLQIDQLTKAQYQWIINQYAENHAQQTTIDFNNHLKAAILDLVDEGELKRNPCRKVAIKGKQQVNRKEKFLNLHEVEKLIEVMDLDLPLLIKARHNRLKNNGFLRTEAFNLWKEGNSFRAISERLNIKIRNGYKCENGIEPVIKRMYEALQVNYDWLIYLALKTGLRLGELLGLTKKDFDFDNLTLAVNKTFDYKHSFQLENRAKTRSSIRTIAINQELANKFQRLLAGYQDDELLFLKQGHRFFNSTINHRLEKLCKAAGITPISLHSLRHTHASILLYKGISLHSISKRLGHSKVSITQDVYSHVIDELQRKDDALIRGAI